MEGYKEPLLVFHTLGSHVATDSDKWTERCKLRSFNRIFELHVKAPNGILAAISLRRVIGLASWIELVVSGTLSQINPEL